MVQVKICGINAPDALAAASEAGADWVGFNFYPPSPRAVTPAQAARLAVAFPGGPKRVGLFVTPRDEDVKAALDAVKLSAMQVYDDLARAQELQIRFGIPVWLAIGVAARSDLPTHASGLARVLLEPRAPAGAKLPGGNAKLLDWALLRGWAAPCPWMLAGGLTPGNVRAAIESSGAPAVDVSSGVERARGIKDPALIRAFVAAAKSCRSMTGQAAEIAEAGAFDRAVGNGPHGEAR